jgi:mono/diheme cytochrome c family protein
MQKIWWLSLVFVMFFTGGGAEQTHSTTRIPTTKSQVEHGQYLVEEVAKCPECHTPRNERGELKRDAWLRGARTWIRPVAPIQNWADRAPSLAGLPSFTDEQAEHILEQGTGPNGEELRPPMHIYHMNHADAQAIVAYLKSIPRGSSQE